MGMATAVREAVEVAEIRNRLIGVLIYCFFSHCFCFDDPSAGSLLNFGLIDVWESYIILFELHSI